jgi:hypothetical protein
MRRCRVDGELLGPNIMACHGKPTKAVVMERCPWCGNLHPPRFDCPMAPDETPQTRARHAPYQECTCENPHPDRPFHCASEYGWTPPERVFDEDKMRRAMAPQLAEELGKPEQWWYLSFRDPARATVPEGHLGGCFVRAKGVASALIASHRLGINPGGEGLARPLGVAVPPPGFEDRLLSRDELEAEFLPKVGDGAS